MSNIFLFNGVREKYWQLVGWLTGCLTDCLFGWLTNGSVVRLNVKTKTMTHFTLQFSHYNSHSSLHLISPLMWLFRPKISHNGCITTHNSFLATFFIFTIASLPPLPSITTSQHWFTALYISPAVMSDSPTDHYPGWTDDNDFCIRIWNRFRRRIRNQHHGQQRRHIRVSERRLALGGRCGFRDIRNVAAVSGVASCVWLGKRSLWERKDHHWVRDAENSYGVSTQFTQT